MTAHKDKNDTVSGFRGLGLQGFQRPQILLPPGLCCQCCSCFRFSFLWACFWQCPGLLSYLLKDPSSDYCFPRMYYVTSNWDSTLEFPFPIQSLPRKISWVIQILTFASNYRKHILHFKKTLRLNHYLTRGKLTWLIHIKMLPW